LAITGTNSPEKMANASLFFGISACLLMLFPTYLILLALPSGIMAIVFGKRAVEKRSNKKLRASIGKYLGIFVLAVLTIEIILALILVIFGKSDQ